MQSAWGGRTLLLISVVILTSILGATNGMIMTAPRVYYAMAEDGTFFRSFGRLSVKFKVPLVAIVAQAVWASALTLIGSFQQLFTYVVFTAWIFYGLTVAAVIVLRRRDPLRPRSFLTPAYPWMPIAFVLAAAGITLSTVVADHRSMQCLGSAWCWWACPCIFYFMPNVRRRMRSNNPRHFAAALSSSSNVRFEMR